MNKGVRPSTSGHSEISVIKKPTRSLSFYSPKKFVSYKEETNLLLQIVRN